MRSTPAHKTRRLFGITIAILFRFVVPTTLCVGFIAAAIGDYDQRFANPPDHFTPARAITTIVILAGTLGWIGWRFYRFLKVEESPFSAPDAQQRK